MTRVLPRTNFHSSQFIRCLADLSIVDAVEPASAFAEKLSLWIPFTDAISLSALHNDSGTNAPTTQPSALSDAHVAANAECDKVQTTLVNSITKSFSHRLGKSHLELPKPVLALPMELAAAYLPYRHFYEAHQRDMEMRILPLRVNVREALSNASPSLKKLADLDAAFERIMRERESKLLAKVPLLLKKRFEELFKAHQQRLEGSKQADNPAAWIKAGAWLAQFCDELKALLLAELALRLQPTVGMIEGLNAALTDSNNIE